MKEKEQDKTKKRLNDLFIKLYFEGLTDREHFEYIMLNKKALEL